MHLIYLSTHRKEEICMSDWGIFLATFLAATVEWVEAFTIVLAVSMSIGWGRSAGAAASALFVLAGMTIATSGVLRLGLDMRWLQFLIGVFLLLFGVRWLAKAVARQAGLKPMHDEEEEFEETRHELEQGDRQAAWLIAFKGVFLEGLEVWLIVVALGMKGHHPAAAVGAALLALLVVTLVGMLVRAPLRRVPENAIKFVVGAMIVTFGTFWTIEALGGSAAWPLGDWSLLVLVAFYGMGGLVMAVALRRRRAQMELSSQEELS
jgi:Ca2+/H+ antiporter, TMEM165/GDT1 family